MGSKHSMQPIVEDGDGVLRFLENPIVQMLLDEGPHDLNSIALRQFPKEDEAHFAQLIGYSVSGWGDLSYVSREECAIADSMAERLANPPNDENERLKAENKVLLEVVSELKKAIKEICDISQELAEYD